VLPALTPQGRLPVGRHEASLQEVRERFVDQAPHQDRRQLLFSALTLYADAVRQLVPEARLWIDGGFVTLKPEPPDDIDVVIVSYVPPTLTDEQLAPLLTLQGVTSTDPPIALNRLQPVAGMIDGFFAAAHIPEVLAYWDDFWSKVKGAPDTERKGYVEVRL